MTTEFSLILDILQSLFIERLLYIFILFILLFVVNTW